MLFVLLTPLTIHAESQIPEWVKINAGWWSDDTIDDNTFIHGIEYLIKENTITVSEIKKVESNYSLIPEWVKINAGLWADGDVDEKTFLNSLEFLIKNGIISAMVEKDFLDPNSWLTFNLVKQGIGEIPQGYTAIIFDKGFVYFSPRLNSFGSHGEVLRYDTTQDFQSADAWSVLNTVELTGNEKAVGFGNPYFDDGFIYLPPESGGTFLKINVFSNSFDELTIGTGSNPLDIVDIEKSGKYLFFISKSHGTVLRYDTTQDFESADSWTSFNLKTVGNNLRYYAMSTDGNSIYFSPYMSEKFLKLKLYD